MHLSESQPAGPASDSSPISYLLRASKKSLLTTGEDRSVILEPGDGMIYKGCERPHWRYLLPGTIDMQLNPSQEQLYYHQIFFHYVLQDGERAHCAWDNGQ